MAQKYELKTPENQKGSWQNRNTNVYLSRSYLQVESADRVKQISIVFTDHMWFCRRNMDPALPPKLTQGLEDNALKNDQVLGLLQIGLRLRGQAVTHWEAYRSNPTRPHPEDYI